MSSAESFIERHTGEAENLPDVMYLDLWLVRNSQHARIVLMETRLTRNEAIGVRSPVLALMTTDEQERPREILSCTLATKGNPPCGLPLIMVGKSVANFVMACLVCDMIDSSLVLK